MATTPIKSMRRRQRRRRKVRQLRDRLAETTDSRRRQQVIAKIQRISPRAPVPGS
jgi:indole-3-glycerol phosphate synthase